MADVKPIPEGCEGPIPHLVVEGCSDALGFYARALGAEERMRMPGPDGQKIMHAEIQVGGHPIYLCDDFPEMGGPPRSPKAIGGSPVTIHRYVTDCDASLKRFEEAGGNIMMPATDMFWGDRYGMGVDPYGHVWSFATHKADLTPEQMGQKQAEFFASGACGGGPEGGEAPG